MNGIKSSRKVAMRDKLLARDGEACWLCSEVMTFGDTDAPHACTIEHLLDRSLGGPNASGNLVLCGYRCNQKMMGLTLVEKIKLRDATRKPKEKLRPSKELPIGWP